MVLRSTVDATENERTGTGCSRIPFVTLISGNALCTSADLRLLFKKATPPETVSLSRLADSSKGETNGGILKQRRKKGKYSFYRNL